MENQPTTDKREQDLAMREAMLPAKLRDWRAKLNAKAKQEKRYRFHSLYGMVSHPECLKAAWAKVRANGGSPGVDGVSIEQVEKEGEEGFLKEIEESLKKKSYRCAPVRRAYILKENGKQRPLGIPTVRDRVVQSAVLFILEPIFEADFKESSYGFRPGRGAPQALEAIMKALEGGRMSIYDADLEGYFDSIPHDKLMAAVEQRVVDGSVLGLIRQWLKAVVVEKEEGKPPRERRNKTGTPQGGVISPLLANIYLHWFDHAFEQAIARKRMRGAVLVRYADDFVVLARKIGAEIREFIEEKIEAKLGLKLNRQKTRVINLREAGESLEFLGYRFGLDRDRFGRKLRYLNQTVSKKALQREREQLRQMTDKRQCWKPLPVLVAELNLHLKGWANYFAHGRPSEAFRQINHYVTHRIGRHLRRRSQRPWRCPKGMSYYAYLYEHLGLYQL